MQNIFITNVTAVLKDRLLKGAAIHVVDGKIKWVGLKKTPPKGAEVIDGKGHYLLPGFVDIHVHGAMGVDTMTADVKGFQKMARYFARTGVTSFLPTTLTATDQEIQKVLGVLKPLIGNAAHGARMVGVHLEGPYLNQEYCGAQEKNLIRAAKESEYKKWLASGIIKLVTVAPEIPSNEKFIRACAANKIAVAVGHSAATYEQAMKSFEQGVDSATHTFNRMRGDLSRDPGVKVAVLNSDAVVAQIICDGVHVHPANILNLYKRKGVDGVALITDAVSAMGMKDGAFKLGNQTAIKKGKSARLKNGDLAGAVVPFDVAFRNLIKATGCTLWEASRMASLTPATSIGLGKKIGAVAKGYSADLILMDQKLRVKKVFVAGKGV